MSPKAVTRLSEKIQVHGHRGARALRAENSLPAFDYALSLGVDVLELDLLVTADNILVLTHDPYINKEICKYKDDREMGDKKILVRSLSLTQIKEFDCGSKVNPDFPRQVLTPPPTEIPTFDEFVASVKTSPHKAARKVWFNVEAKRDPRHPEEAPPAAEFARLVITSLKAHGIFSRTIFQSFDHEVLKQARILDANTIISALTSKGDTSLNYAEIIRTLKPNYLSPNFREISSEEVAQAHSQNVQVVPWTVNNATDWSFQVLKGMDGIITDDPAGLIEFLKANKLR